MYYEVYIDVLFAINLVMDYLLLRIVNRILKCSATHLQTLLGSALGAFLMCVIVILPIHSRLLPFLFMHGCVNFLMVRAGCGCKGKKMLVRGVLALYLSSFLLGGVLQVLLTYSQIRTAARKLLLGTSPVMTGLRTFLLLSVTSYVLITIGVKIYGCLKGKVSNIIDVTLSVHGKSEKIKGLYDTGNQLTDTLTGRPVCVLEYKVLKGLLTKKEGESVEKMLKMGQTDAQIAYLKPHYILFHSVGKEQGLLLAVTLEELCLHVEGEQRIVRHPILALTQEALSHKNNFQIIINPNMLDS